MESKEKIGGTDNKIKKAIGVRVRLAFLVMVMVAGVIAYKIFEIQFKQGEKWREQALKSQIFYRPLKATRGNIYSDNESILATSLPFYRVAFDPTIADVNLFDTKIDSLSFLLASFFKDHSEAEYKRRIIRARQNNKKYVRLNSRQINYQQKKLIATWPIFRNGQNKGGVIFEKVEKRFKPFGSLAGRTIGFVNESKNGAGLEFTFNGHLAGQDGEALFEKIAGAYKPLFNGTEVKALPGYDIKTTIDINLQDVAQNALYKALQSHDADYGCVLLMEVKTGEIKAIANLGKAGPGVYVENYNYAVGNHGRTEPGSTFKLASMMALFEDANITLEDTIDTGYGEWNFGGVTMTDAKEGGYQKITVKEVFEKSSNIGIAKLIERQFGNDNRRFVEYIEKFGLTKPLGFQMHGEAKPFVKHPSGKSWSRTTLSRMSIGYELKLAPLHTLAFYNAVANNGVMIQPIIVKEIRKADKTIETFEPQILNKKICSDNTLAKLRAMMEGVVEHGTGKNVRNPYYTVAGKTGTSRKIKNGQYIKSYSTSFVGYFPADKPKYSCIVIVDSPKSAAQYGGDVAAPVFRELADKAFARDLALHKPWEFRLNPDKAKLPSTTSGYHDDLKFICNQFGISHHSVGDEEWVKTSSQDHSVVLNPLKVTEGQVANVLGMTLRDALFILGNQGLRVRVVGSGRVKGQSLNPGSRISKGSYITINLS